MVELLIIFSGLYFLITIVIHIGLSARNKSNDHQPSVTILIAARNEEKNLPACLASLERINYPTNKMEIVVLNDRSADNTKNIAQNYCNKHLHFQLLDIEEDIPGIKGKMNVLCQGIEKTEGDIILITDADCEVPPGWVKEYVKYFHKDVGICGGMTLLSQPNKREKIFHRLQAFDWIYLQAVASGICQIGLPVSILGNNFAFRRAVYEDVGGFRKLGFSVTEDMKLLQAIHKLKKWKTIYPLQSGTSIYSKPVDTIKEFFLQRKRWVLGGKDTQWWGILIMVSSFSAHLIVFLALIAGVWTVPVLAGLIVLFISDITIVIRMFKRINRFELVKYFIWFELFYIIYSIIFAIVFLFSKNISWKGKNHKINS